MHCINETLIDCPGVYLSAVYYEACSTINRMQLRDDPLAAYVQLGTRQSMSIHEKGLNNERSE